MARGVRLMLLGVLALVVTAGCGLLGSSPSSTPATAEAIETPLQLAATPEVPITTPPSESPSPSRKPSPSKSKAKKPSPSATTEDPNNFQAPACATYDGKAVSKASAKSALTAAAAKHYWPLSAPSLTVSSDLVRSVAWNESGWQSNIINCDGGRGLMQVMPDTVSMINSRFVQTYDVKDYKQNAILGANYLAWLTKDIGDNYFKGSYDLSTSKCKSASSWCLLNTVIAAYHAGVGTVESAASSKTLPVPSYVYVVRSLMTSCYCDRY